MFNGAWKPGDIVRDYTEPFPLWVMFISVCRVCELRLAVLLPVRLLAAAEPASSASSAVRKASADVAAIALVCCGD